MLNRLTRGIWIGHSAIAGYESAGEGWGRGRILSRLFIALGLLFISATHAATEQVTYYHLDALGSPVSATNAQGDVTWRETYRPYGDRLNNEPAAQKNTRGYTGHPHNTTLGLTYTGARWYDPTLGRFMGVDPAAVSEKNPHSFNRYSYGNNNPYKYVDPDGNSPLLLIPVFVGLFTMSDYANAPAPGQTPVIMSTGDRFSSIQSALTPVRGVGSAVVNVTSNEARREAMRQQGIPTSQQSSSQSKSESGREYRYEVPRAGGGTQKKSVQDQTLDRSHPGQGHWEAGTVKVGEKGGIQTNRYGTPRLENDKSKVFYDR